MTDFDVVDALAVFAEDLKSEAAFAERLHAAEAAFVERLHAAVVKMKAAHESERDALLVEVARLRAALDAVMDACDAECAGCGAYYVAKEALGLMEKKP